ncbi:MAG: nitrous oxide-stimulated promoter family protein [Candidatus Coatesbacteria bacterium]|nr:MAG: nitrous oxide-stimulated promoter family protein [Candidatus Coatesbacteria bacterium]
MERGLRERRKFEREARTLAGMVGIFCRANHRDAPKARFSAGDVLFDIGKNRPELCAGCAELLDYGLRKLAKCPLNPKPACKKCPVHCYEPLYRDRVRAVMRFSGPYLIKRGRLDLIFKFYL